LIDRPSNTLNPTLLCMDNRGCTKQFPKNVLTETVTWNYYYLIMSIHLMINGGHPIILDMRNISNEFVVVFKCVVLYSTLLSIIYLVVDQNEVINCPT